MSTDEIRNEIINLPNIVLPKVGLLEYLGALRNHFCEGYMPSSGRKGFNSKPKYVNRVTHITDLYEGSEVYCLDDFDIFSLGPDAFNDQLGEDFFRKNGKATLICAIETNGIRLMTVLGDDRTFISIGEDKSRTQWVQWTEDFSLPINLTVLDEILNMI